LLHDLPGAPFLVTPQVAGRQIRTKVMGVSGWMNVMSEGGGLWGSLACYGNFFGRAGSTQKMEVYSWEIIERWWIFHCLVEMMTDFACLSLSEHVRKDLLNGNFAWGNIYDDQCS
jgi:hypothetical protein